MSPIDEYINPICYNSKAVVSGLSPLVFQGQISVSATRMAQERLAVLDEVKLRKMRRALDIADEQLELKRDRVSDALKALVDDVSKGVMFYHFVGLLS